MSEILNLTVNVVSHNKINLQWDKITDTIEYRVFRQDKNSPEKLILKSAMTGYQDLMLEGNSFYTYRVEAVRENEQIVHSPLRSAATYSRKVQKPGLLFSSVEAENLRNRANIAPWDKWRDAIVSTATNYVNTSLDSIPYNQLQNITDRVAAAYFFGYGNQYAHKAKEMILGVLSEKTDLKIYHLMRATTLLSCCVAYDFIEDILLKDEINLIRQGFEKYAGVLYRSVESYRNNWKMIMATGLAAAGALLDNLLYLRKADEIFQEGLESFIRAEGGLYEGQGYESYTMQYSTIGMYILMHYGFRDFFSNPRYQQNIKFLVKQWLPFGQIPTFEDSSNCLTGHWKQLYRNALPFVNDPKVARGLEFLRQKLEATEDYIEGGASEGDDNVVSYILYHSQPDARQYTESNPTWYAKDSGLAFFRQGYEDDHLCLVLNNKPFGSPHRLPDDGSFELWGYGGYLIHNPGYPGWGKQPNHDYNRDGRAHNTVKIKGISNLGNTIQNPFPITITTHSIDLVEANVSEKYENHSGSFRRSILFKKPHGRVPGYFILYDKITTNDASTPVEWFLHGKSADMEIQGRDILWNIERWRGHGENIALHVHILSDQLKLSRQQEDFPTFIWSSKYPARDVAYLKGEKLGGAKILSVLYPRKHSTKAPSLVDEMLMPGVQSCTVNATDRIYMAMEEGINIKLPGITCEAELLFVGKTSNQVDTYVIHKGYIMKMDGLSIASDKPISIVLDLMDRKLTIDAIRSGTAVLIKDNHGFVTEYDPQKVQITERCSDEVYFQGGGS